MKRWCLLLSIKLVFFSVVGLGNTSLKDAIAFEEKGDYPQAEAILNRLIGQSEKNIAALTVLGRIHLKNKHKKESGLELLNRAIKVNPKYQPAYQELIEFYFKQNNLYEVRILYQDMIEKIGPKKEFYAGLCNVLSKDSLYDEATRACIKGIQLDPHHVKNYMILSEIYKVTSSTELSESIIKKTALAFPKSALAQQVYGELLYSKRNLEEAFAVFKKAYSAEPQSSRVMVSVANAAFDLQKYDEALDFYIKACQADRQTGFEFRRATNTFRLQKNLNLQNKYEVGWGKCP